MQTEFYSKQKLLIEASVVPADVLLITSQNKIQRVVDQGRRNHGGPISKESEVDDILRKFTDDKSRKSGIILEIRYR